MRVRRETTFIRFTRDVGLLEISRDYMRGSTSIRGGMYTVLTRVLVRLSPFLVRVVGETRSGGFMSWFAADTPVYPLLGPLPGETILWLTRMYAETRQRGYLRLDGVVESIREPYHRYTVQVHPLPRRLYGRLRLRTTHHYSTVYIEGDTGLLEQLYHALMRGEEPRPPCRRIVERVVADGGEDIECDTGVEKHVYIVDAVAVIPMLPPPARAYRDRRHSVTELCRRYRDRQGHVIVYAPTPCLRGRLALAAQLLREAETG